MSTHEGVQRLVRRTHEQRVLGILRRQGALTRGEIARRAGLSRTTLSEIAADLLRRGAITIVDTDARARVGSGRPAERLALDPASGQHMGIDFGHRRVHVAVADASHEIIAAGSAEYAEGSPWGERLGVAFDLIDEVVGRSGIHFGALQAIGIGVPGPYSPTGSAAHRRAGWGDHAPSEPVMRAFQERFGAPVVVDNNARFAAIAEAIDSAEGGTGDLLYVRVSDGLGGGVVVDGRLVMGSAGYAGELGHITVAPGGELCRCGRRGCLETVASVPAILAQCLARGADVRSLVDLGEARTDPAVDEVLREVGSTLGRVLATAATALNPAEIVVGGAIVRVAPALVDHVAESVEHEMAGLLGDAAPLVRPARYGDEGGALGAVAAFYTHSLRSPLIPSGNSFTSTPESTPIAKRSIS